MSGTAEWDEAGARRYLTHSSISEDGESVSCGPKAYAPDVDESSATDRGWLEGAISEIDRLRTHAEQLREEILDVIEVAHNGSYEHSCYPLNGCIAAPCAGRQGMEHNCRPWPEADEHEPDCRLCGKPLLGDGPSDG